MNYLTPSLHLSLGIRTTSAASSFFMAHPPICLALLMKYASCTSAPTAHDCRVDRPPDTDRC
jgi:hypothetical protein